MPNEYSKTWFSVFMSHKDASETAFEAAFIERQLPLPHYQSVLDLCCGYGRHANLLARDGYSVTGVDRDREALRIAEKAAVSNTNFIQMDMRHISTLPHFFDAVICMWHSFGYFEEGENNLLLKQISGILRPQGRFVLDVCNKHFFGKKTGVREYEKQGVLITEKIEKQGDRFTVRLNYGDTPDMVDTFNWQLYSKDEMISVCKQCNLVCKAACAWCDEDSPITDDSPRMQLVFEKQ